MRKYARRRAYDPEVEEECPQLNNQRIVRQQFVIKNQVLCMRAPQLPFLWCPHRQLTSFRQRVLVLPIPCRHLDNYVRRIDLREVSALRIFVHSVDVEEKTRAKNALDCALCTAFEFSSDVPETEREVERKGSGERTYMNRNTCKSGYV